MTIRGLALLALTCCLSFALVLYLSVGPPSHGGTEAPAPRAAIGAVRVVIGVPEAYDATPECDILILNEMGSCERKEVITLCVGPPRSFMFDSLPTGRKRIIVISDASLGIASKSFSLESGNVVECIFDLKRGLRLASRIADIGLLRISSATLWMEFGVDGSSLRVGPTDCPFTASGGYDYTLVAGASHKRHLRAYYVRPDGQILLRTESNDFGEFLIEGVAHSPRWLRVDVEGDTFHLPIGATLAKRIVLPMALRHDTPPEEPVMLLALQEIIATYDEIRPIEERQAALRELRTTFTARAERAGWLNKESEAAISALIEDALGGRK